MYYQESSDIEADGLQTLYLMNPNFMGYTDTQQQQHQQHQGMLFLNSNALNTASVPHAPPQHLVGVPLPASSLHNPNHHGLLQRMWSSVADQSQPHVPPPSTVVPGNPGGSTGGATTDLASQLGFHRPMAISPTQQQQQQQGCLSLSLSPQRQISFRSVIPLNGDQHRDIRGSGVSSSSINNGVSGMILGSKYLKVAQDLLDEVVHVGKGIIKEDDFDGDKEKKSDMNKESIPLASSDVNNPTSGGDQSRVLDLTIAQRQELQMKKAKLVSMLEEVEQRYRQYHHQMQIIVTSFEQAAGSRSATPYTQMAIHAISKQFRCLKDAIFGQIKSTSKNLGEEGAEEGLGVKNIEGSGLKFVDHHRRQQRALQQLGMTQTNAWRPQRGLPERAVSVLRGWLFEHFLHPYPKDSDKIMLAKQTGLTRSQVLIDTLYNY